MALGQSSTAWVGAQVLISGLFSIEGLKPPFVGSSPLHQATVSLVLLCWVSADCQLVSQLVFSWISALTWPCFQLVLWFLSCILSWFSCFLLLLPAVQLPLFFDAACSGLVLLCSSGFELSCSCCGFLSSWFPADLPAAFV
ncbi:unnamed protein product [Ilex paraguariensis]|uniref:Uncharacterized protein n=1 Tax=Ilex paraguariensis TaxID=185542 RepID=A0ABC8S4P2_9AQUA